MFGLLGYVGVIRVCLGELTNQRTDEPTNQQKKPKKKLGHRESNPDILCDREEY